MKPLLPVLALVLAGCLRPSEPPWVGECAVYPEGSYQFGDIGIGTCLSAPADLQFVDGGSGPWLAVSNSNAFRDFTGGSVLFIDWSSVDLDNERNLVSELVAHAVGVDSFAGTLSWIPERDLLAVPIRFSDEARTRSEDDEVVFLDIADPAGAEPAPVAEEGSTSIAVEADPFATAFDPTSNLLFVGNRTAHTVSVVDMAADPVVLRDALGQPRIDGSRWVDADGSGSRAEFTMLEALTGADVRMVTETWTLTWVEGTRRLWLPVMAGSTGGVMPVGSTGGPVEPRGVYAGVRRATSGGDGRWTWSGYGTELDPATSGGHAGEVRDPFYYDSSSIGPRMVFSDGGDLRGAAPVEDGDSYYVANWGFEADPLLVGDEGAWDEVLDGPAAVVSEGTTWLFYDGTSGTGQTAIGVATSGTGYSDFARLGDGAVMVAGGAHDAVAQADPMVLRDAAADRWRMFYSAFDGSRWSIGQAWSDDLETWTAETEPVIAIDGGDIAAPEVFASDTGFILWASYRASGNSGWQVAQARSWDGTTWTLDGVILDYPIESLGRWDDTPPGLAAEADVQQTFDMVGEEWGDIGLHPSCGDTIQSTSYGWKFRVAVGQQGDVADVGEAGDLGWFVTSVDDAAGLAWIQLESSEGIPSIGIASWDGLHAIPEADPIFEAADSGFDQDGVFSPVVVADGGGWVMFYAGTSDDFTVVGRATSADGRTWQRDPDPVLDLGDDWDFQSVVPGSVEILEDGTWRLWYTGSDGSRQRIGLATSPDGTTFTRVEGEDGWIFGPGTPGEWDDSGVRGPYVVTTDDLLHLWYSGSDGTTQRIGHASAATADAIPVFTRDVDVDGTPRPVLEPTASLFDFGGVDRPVVLVGDQGYTLLYRGVDGSYNRPGLAFGTDEAAFYKAPAAPSAGDWLQFSTAAGQDGVNAIDLDVATDDMTVTGVGMDALAIDEERGFLFVASKLLSYIVVLDVRDDSTTSFSDLNYMGIEAVLSFDSAGGSEWFRSMMVLPGTSHLYALTTSPESVVVFDLDLVEDDEHDEIVRDANIGWLAAPRGGDLDHGSENVTNLGPAGMALLPDGYTLVVTNYNDNSLSVYDLRMAGYGQLIGEVPNLCENPYSVRTTADGTQVVVGCYEGKVEDDRVASTLAVVDVDRASPTWLEVRTWIVNE